MQLDPHSLLLWCDEALLAINKPAGLLTLPDGYDPSLPHVKSLLSPEFSRLWIVHRLDRETSGVLLLARTAASHRALNTQFEQRQVVKIYHALVAGAPEWNEQMVDFPLRPNGDRRHRTVVDPRRGKPAVTHFRVLERLGAFALLEAVPHTGRTHQIRAHLAALGLHLAADELYGGAPGEALLARLGLHAWSLSFTHPLNHTSLCLEAPYPDDLMVAFRHLRS